MDLIANDLIVYMSNTVLLSTTLSFITVGTHGVLGFWGNVFYRGTSLPTLRYSGIIDLLRVSAISDSTFLLSYSF